MNTYEPSDYPPGPERRRALLERGLPVSDADYTDEEYDAAAAEAARMSAAPYVSGRDPAAPPHPFQLPPGPERRALMTERGLNISPHDYTRKEWRELAEKNRQPVSEVRKRRQRALAKLHTAFVQDNLDAPFTPSPTSGDYNVHHVDIEPDPDAQWAFHQQAMKIVTGQLDDELEAEAVLGEGAECVPSQAEPGEARPWRRLRRRGPGHGPRGRVDG